MLVAVVLGVGCASAPAPATSASPTAASASSPPAPTVAEATPAPAASSSEVASFPVVGIATCDAYLTRYRACMSTQHDPKEVDARARTMAEGWRKAATNDAARDALTNACVQATNALANVPGCAP
jgi:hypothetical protein